MSSLSLSHSLSAANKMTQDANNTTVLYDLCVLLNMCQVCRSRRKQREQCLQTFLTGVGSRRAVLTNHDRTATITSSSIRCNFSAQSVKTRFTPLARCKCLLSRATNLLIGGRKTLKSYISRHRRHTDRKRGRKRHKNKLGILVGWAIGVVCPLMGGLPDTRMLSPSISRT